MDQKFKLNARNLLGIPHDHEVSLSAHMEMFGDEMVEVDPLAWPSLRGDITTIWVADIHVPAALQLQTHLNLLIQSCDRKTPELYIRTRPSLTILKMKQGVQKHRGIAVDKQRLYYDGIRLVDENTLNFYRIPSESVIDLIPEQTGGKPVIYLFSSTPMDARVLLQLVAQWSFSALYPVKRIEGSHNGGQLVAWDVSVRPDSMLLEKDSQTEVSYLYWEAK